MKNTQILLVLGLALLIAGGAYSLYFIYSSCNRLYCLRKFETNHFDVLQSRKRKSKNDKETERLLALQLEQVRQMPEPNAQLAIALSDSAQEAINSGEFNNAIGLCQESAGILSNQLASARNKLEQNWFLERLAKARYLEAQSYKGLNNSIEMTRSLWQSADSFNRCDLRLLDPVSLKRYLQVLLELASLQAVAVEKSRLLQNCRKAELIVLNSSLSKFEQNAVKDKLLHLLLNANLRNEACRVEYTLSLPQLLESAKSWSQSKLRSELPSLLSVMRRDEMPEELALRFAVSLGEICQIRDLDREAASVYDLAFGLKMKDAGTLIKFERISLLDGYSNLLFKQRRFAEMEKVLPDLIRKVEKLESENSIHAQSLRLRYCRALLESGKSKEAAACLQEAYEKRPPSLEKTNVDNLLMTAELYLALSEYEKAESLFEQALSFNREHNRRTGVAASIWGLRWALLAQNKPFVQSLAAEFKTYSSNCSGQEFLLVQMRNCADFLAQIGQTDLALDSYASLAEYAIQLHLLGGPRSFDRFSAAQFLRLCAERHSEKHLPAARSFSQLVSST